MSDFPDVEQFGREHAACGGITPGATPRSTVGYLLTLTCVCGASLDRIVTVEEAKKPLPLPLGAARRPPAPARTAPPPNADLEEAMRAALAAEEAAIATAPRAPAAPPAPPSEQDLGAVMRDALETADDAETAAIQPPRAPAASAPPARTSPARLNLDRTIRTALTQQARLRATPAAARPRTRRLGLLLFALVSLGVAAGIYLGLGLDGPPGAPVASAPAAPPLDQQQRAALEEILRSLRQLQSASSPTTSLSVYSSRVIFAKSDVDRFLTSTPPGPARTQVHQVLEIHLLASSAWRARSLDQKEMWEAVGQDPTIDLCPSVKRVVDFAAQPENVSRAQARGAAVASAIPLLWECADEKLAVLDQVAGGH